MYLRQDQPTAAASSGLDSSSLGSPMLPFLFPCFLVRLCGPFLHALRDEGYVAFAQKKKKSYRHLISLTYESALPIYVYIC